MADESLAKIDKFLIEKSANDRPHQSSQSRDKNPSEVSAADSMEILKFKRKNPQSTGAKSTQKLKVLSQKQTVSNINESQISQLINY